MKPFLLKSHERPLSQVKFNEEGDLLITCAKDGNCPVALFYTDNGQRIGTYQGHTGAVMTCDFTRDSRWLLTAGQDSSVRLWDVQHGDQLFMWNSSQPARACAFAKANHHIAAFTTDQFATTTPSIRFVRIAEIPQDSSDQPTLQIDLARTQRCQRVAFSDCDSVLIAACDDGMVRKFDVETGKLMMEEQIHNAEIVDLQVSPDGTHGITASKDKTAKIIDMDTLQVIRTYKHLRPINSAAMSPLNHIAIVGGQDASEVTTTADAAGGFETHFFHKVLEEEFGQVRGHFGPVNSVAITPDGKSFVTGGEDGFVRLQHFDMDYLTTDFFPEV